jgi:geranylgeranyl pyrophosphate synthase
MNAQHRTRGIPLSEYLNILKQEVEAVERALHEFLTAKIEQIEHLGTWHKTYYENVKEYMTRGGKRLRPVLVVVGHKAVNEKADAEKLYRAACSVEILHNGSLLHDDLIDHDETRRGGKTFHATYRDLILERGAGRDTADNYGMTMAILGGDSLINLGAQAITSANLDPDVGMKCQHLYQTAFQDLVDGVLLEMHMVKDPDATAEAYLEMVRMKTAVLFDKSLVMGATIARASEAQIEALKEFGVKVGQAFQVQDDILGSFGDEEKTGKSTSGDIREGKKTMLVFEAYCRSTPEQRQILDDLLGKDGMTEQEVGQVRSVFRDSGALEACQQMMDYLLTAGQKALDKASPPFSPRYKEFMVAMSDFLIQRDY